MSDRQYNLNPAYRQSHIKTLINGCPKEFIHQVENPSSPTPAMERGTCVHLMALTPDETKLDIGVYTGAKRQGKAWTEFKTANINKQILMLEKEFIQCQHQADEVKAYPIWQRIMKDNPIIEKPIYWSDPDFPNIKLKSKPDIVSDNYIVDLKTTSSISDFEKQFWSLRYDFQAAAYSRAVRQEYGDSKIFVIIAVESKQPNIVKHFVVLDETVEYGEITWKKALEKLNNCVETDTWPDHSEEETHLIALPEWRREQIKEEVL